MYFALTLIKGRAKTMAYRKVNTATGTCSEMGGEGPCSTCKDITNPSCEFPSAAELANAEGEPEGNIIEFPGLFNLIQFPGLALG